MKLAEALSVRADLQNMTLKELLDKVDFDSLIPYLKSYGKRYANTIYGFREAYDILRNMEPSADFEGEAMVRWSGEAYGNNQWIGVFHLDGDIWEDALAKRIVIGENVNLSIEEIAAKCLWEMTFYGFSPNEITKTFDDMLGAEKRNRYDILLDRLEESEWRHQTPRKYRSKHDGMRLTGWGWVKKDLYRKGMNRPKRMREHRQETRKKYLKSMSRRENNILDLMEGNSTFVRRDLDFILEVKYGMRYDYRSVTGPWDSVSDTMESVEGRPTDENMETDHDMRLDYILDSITKYQSLDLTQYDNAVVGIFYSPEYPVGHLALSGFWAEIRNFFGYEDIRTGAICDTGCGREIRAVLLLNKMQ